MQRRILAIAAIFFLLCAGAIWLWRPGAETWLTGCWWGGTVLAAAWLAYDDVQRLPNWLVLTIPVVLIVMMRRPVLVLLLIPLAIILAAMRGRRRENRR